MTTAEITIKENIYPVAFNFNTYRKYCKAKGLERLSDFDKLLTFDTGEDLKFSQIENQLDLILEAVKEGCRIMGIAVDVTIDDLGQEMTDRPGFLAEATKIMADTQPVAESKKKQPATSKAPGKG